jgi:hypothetical protein
MRSSRSTSDIITRTRFAFEHKIRENRKKSQTPDSRVIYCDVHRGSRMHPAVTWSITQNGFVFGKDLAGCNPLNHWLCREPGCTRCYDPDFARHFPLSALYGGHSPVRECGKRGEALADSLQSEHLRILDPNGAIRPLTKNEQKESSELALFNSFAPAAGIHVDEGTARNARDPDPDIRCMIAGREHWFELGRIVNQDLAERINPKRRTRDVPFSFSQEEPLASIINKKRRKKYLTGGSPVDLVLYFDHYPADLRAIQRHITNQHSALVSLVNECHIRRVWLYDWWSRRVLWTSH